MKRLRTIMISLALAAGLLGLATPALAATNVFKDVCSGKGSASSACKENGSKNPLTGSNGTLYKITRIIAIIAGIAAVIMILVGGFMYILSGGDSNKVNTAKNTIIYAAVGLVVIGLGQAIIAFVLNKI